MFSQNRCFGRLPLILDILPSSDEVKDAQKTLMSTGSESAQSRSHRSGRFAIKLWRSRTQLASCDCRPSRASAAATAPGPSSLPPAGEPRERRSVGSLLSTATCCTSSLIASVTTRLTTWGLVSK